MDGDSPRPGPRRGLVAGIALAGALAAVVIAYLLVRGDDSAPPIVERPDPVADLLAWLPATASTRHAFAVWTPALGATPGTGELAALDARLGVAPRPRALGASRGWAERFGWSAAEVTAWATAGESAEIAVLVGTFDTGVVRARLAAAGYTHATYRGIDLYQLAPFGTPGSAVDGDLDAAANAVAIAGDRIVAAADPALVRAALDAALDQTGSLADLPAIAEAWPRVAPSTALVAVDLATHAAACDPTVALAADHSDQYVLIAYGRLGDGGAPRTAVVTTYPDEAAAAADLPRTEAGWTSGFANAGGAGGGIDAFGTVANVGQAGRDIVVTLVEGRDAGWVRAGIRFALPTCEYALGAMGGASPAPPTLTPMQAVRAGLGDPGPDGRFAAVDLAGITAGRGLTAPASWQRSDEIAAWWAALSPLPAFAALPAEAGDVATLFGAYRLAPAAISAVGEVRLSAVASPVGLMVGAWDADALHTTLVGLGYEWIEIGGVTHYASESPPGGAAWRNVALRGDRLWHSADQRAMRAAVDLATGVTAPDPNRDPLVDLTLPFVPNATALVVDGARFDRARCAALRGPLLGTAVAWTADAGAEQGTVVLLPDGSRPLEETLAALDRLAPDLTTWTGGAATPGTGADPAAAGGRRSIRYLGSEARSADAIAVAVGRFTPEPGQPAPSWFFMNAEEGCRLSG